MKRATTREGNREMEIYRQMLVRKRDSVLGGLGIKFDTLAKMGRVAEEDQAQISHDEFVSLRLNSLDYGQLRLVEEALDRIRSGDYGVCPACDRAIPSKRLQALPWAKYCVECQQEVGTPEEEAAEFRTRAGLFGRQ